MTDFRDEQDRGAKASAVMNNPLVKEAFGQIREAYVDDWSHTDPSDTVKREQLFYLMKALEAFGQIREAYVDDWSHTDPSDTAKREQLFYLMKALEAFEGHFESAIRTGKMASQQVNELN